MTRILSSAFKLCLVNHKSSFKVVAALKPDLSYLLGHFEEIFGGNVHATMADLLLAI